VASGYGPDVDLFQTNGAGHRGGTHRRNKPLYRVEKQSSLTREASVKIARVFAPSQPAITRIFPTLLRQSREKFRGGFLEFCT
jgi:hypothetical protein